MRYQHDTTVQRTLKQVERNPHLKAITVDMSPEFHTWLFQIAASAIREVKKVSTKAAVREATGRGVRVLMKQDFGCLACAAPAENAGVFNAHEKGRLIIYTLCDAHTALDSAELDALVLGALADMEETSGHVQS